MSLVKCEDLMALAEKPRGQIFLGELIRRLISNWIPLAGVEGTNFHAGAANNLPNWDGWSRVVASGATLEHRCLWELSTQNARAQKIRDDCAFAS